MKVLYLGVGSIEDFIWRYIGKKNIAILYIAISR